MIRAMSTDEPYPDTNLMTGAKYMYSPEWHGLVIPQEMTHHIELEHDGEVYDEALVGPESAFECLFEQIMCTGEPCDCPWRPGKIEFGQLDEPPAKRPRTE